MKLVEKFKSAWRFVFAPGAASYDQWRHWRIILVSILIAIVVAVGFGLVLYNLNVSGRFLKGAH